VQSDTKADPNLPVIRVIRLSTGGVLIDRDHAAYKGHFAVPPAPVKSPETFVVDLEADRSEILALQTLLLPLAERVRNGFYGPVRLVISSSDPGVALLVDYLAAKHSLPIFLSKGSSAEAIRAARPAGNVTTTEVATLDAILNSEGVGLTASALAERFGIELTAAGNRLVNLEKRGLVYRLRQPGREADRFIDPRASLVGPTVVRPEAR
jgi:MarR family